MKGLDSLFDYGKLKKDHSGWYWPDDELVDGETVCRIYRGLRMDALCLKDALCLMDALHFTEDLG